MNDITWKRNAARTKEIISIFLLPYFSTTIRATMELSNCRVSVMMGESTVVSRGPWFEITFAPMMCDSCTDMLANSAFLKLGSLNVAQEFWNEPRALNESLILLNIVVASVSE